MMWRNKRVLLPVVLILLVGMAISYFSSVSNGPANGTTMPMMDNHSSFPIWVMIVILFGVFKIVRMIVFQRRRDIPDEKPKRDEKRKRDYIETADGEILEVISAREQREPRGD
jgi:flagellar biosynthesis/type III secretory pathway M-ring protein FliF/YscJ